MEIRRLGGGGRLVECQRILSEKLAWAEGGILLLPIPTTRDGKYVSGTDISLTDVLTTTEENCILAGYNLPDGLKHSRFSCDVAVDEAFLQENARLTAHGALGYLLTHCERDISRIRVGLVGYGRIGREMLRLLLLFGAELTLYTRRASVAIELGEMGVRAELIDKGTDFRGVDYLINTTPERLIDTASLDPETVIIELASGYNFESDGRLVRLMSLPEKMYPATAGELYANAIIRFLEGEGRV